LVPKPNSVKKEIHTRATTASLSPNCDTSYNDSKSDSFSYTAENKSFYASLHTQYFLQNQEAQEYLYNTRRTSNNAFISEWREPNKDCESGDENKELEEIQNSNFDLFLEEIRMGY
ncbi:19673_t:CDS:2, partial [Gigaspora rosea]